jgi:aspartyl-tRNA(Asn)/glutamyl-tRNA(Gln) amidotransferase subunit B
VVELLKLFEAGKLTNRNAELALRYMVNEKSPPKAVIAKYNLETGGVDVGDIVQKVVAANPKAVTDFKSGDEKAIHFLVGQCMREARGKADANELKKALIRVIGK